MQFDETGVRRGGLMRCCLLTLQEAARAEPEREVAEGEELPCEHCKSTMILRTGAWEWKQEAYER